MQRILLGVTALLLTGAFFLLPKADPLWTGFHAAAATMPSVVINELLWMGSSSSSSDEWIELHNTTDGAVDLMGWSLTRLSNGVEQPMLNIPSGVVEPRGYFVIANFAAAQSQLANEPNLVDSAISLVNSKLLIRLYDAGGVLVDSADDGTGSPLAGTYVAGSSWASMERNPSGTDGTSPASWHTTSAFLGFDAGAPELGTPGAENTNLPPEAAMVVPEETTVGTAISFDASESFDPEGEPLAFMWDFGDGSVGEGTTPTHAYVSIGTYTVILSVSDGVHHKTATSSVTVKDLPPIIPQNKPTNSSPSNPERATAPATTLQLNEVLPNPEGSDAENEFIEIANIGEEPTPLAGWKLTDMTRTFAIGEGTIEPGAVLALWRHTTDIALNNASDTLYLISPEDTIVDGVAYADSKEGKSFSAHPSGDWRWSSPTPDESNTFAEDSEVVADDTSLSVTPLADVQEMDRGERVLVTGTVLALPGVLGARSFYLGDGSDGLQINSSRAPFPELVAGDMVEVTGTIGESQGEKRINIQSTEDVVIVGSGPVPDPLPYDPALSQGAFVLASGTVAEKHGTALTLETSSGSLTVTATRASGVSLKDVASGETVSVVGIWRQGKLYPRSQEDVHVEEPIVLGAATEEEVTPDAPEATTIAVEAQGSVSPLLSVGAPLLAFGVVGAVAWYRKRRTSPQSAQL